MSLERARKTINLQITDKTPQWEHIENPGFLKELTGVDAIENPRQALIDACRILDLDFILPLPEYGELVFMPENGDVNGKMVDRVNLRVVQEPEEVFMFDPFDPPECDYKDNLGIDPRLCLNERAQYFQSYWKSSQDAVGTTAMVPGCNWYTLFHAFGTNVGYEATFVAALTEPVRFKELIEKLAIVSLKQMEALAQTDAELILCHDDLGMSDRTIFSPDWYRENIFPWYKELWKPIKKANKKILFYSDGNIDSIMDDLIQTGIDGLFIDTCSSMETAVERFGGSLVLLGNANVEKMTFGNRSGVEEEVKRCIKYGKGIPGYILCASGHFMSNVPAENIKAYFKAAEILR